MRALFLLFILGFLPLSPARAAERDVLAVIVPPDFSGKSLSVAELNLIFLRKKLYWPNGKRMRPANLPTQHALRKKFSLRVLGNLPEAQTEYWSERYFHGTLPPHVVNSQEAMLRYVSDTAGAIGYVDTCAVDARVKAVAWIDENGTWMGYAPLVSCD